MLSLRDHMLRQLETRHGLESGQSGMQAGSVKWYLNHGAETCPAILFSVTSVGIKKAGRVVPLHQCASKPSTIVLYHISQFGKQYPFVILGLRQQQSSDCFINTGRRFGTKHLHNIHDKTFSLHTYILNEFWYDYN